MEYLTLYAGHASLWFLILFIGAMFGKVSGKLLGFVFLAMMLGIPSTLVHVIFFGS